jgi:hypothetical protein
VLVFFNMPMILLVYKNAYFNIKNLNSFIPNVAISLLKDFEDDIEQLNLNLSFICLTMQLYTTKYSF